jgi:MFS family permease
VTALLARLHEARRDFAAVFGNPNLRRLQLAWAASIVATWAYGITLVVFAYDHGGAGAVGLVAVLRWVPAALVTPFAGLWADRRDRRLLMIGSDLGRAALIAASAAVVVADAPAALVYVLAAFVGIAGTPFRPAEAAYTPTLARTPEELGAANVVAAAIESIGIFAGPAVGGLLLAWTSVATTLFITAVAIGLSAVVLLGIRVSGAPPELSGGGGSVREELLAGARAIWADRKIGLLVGLFGAQTFVDGLLGVLIAVIALSYLDAGASMVGWLNAATGVGGIVGAFAAAVLVGRGRLAGDFGLGVLLFGLPLALVAASHSTLVALLLLGVVGVGNTLTDVAGVTLLQRAAPEAVVGRVFGVLETLLLLTVALGAAVAPALVSLLGTRGALVLAGVLLPALVVASGRALRLIDATAKAPVEVGLLRRVPFFASLPEASIERLARRAREEPMPAGATIVAQGEPGESFYVVRSGAAEVLVDGKATATLGPGDYFGEIALLRDVPRTAAVRARADTDLLVLTRDDFLRAVVGYAPSLASAEVVVARRLGGRI